MRKYVSNDVPVSKFNSRSLHFLICVSLQYAWKDAKNSGTHFCRFLSVHRVWSQSHATSPDAFWLFPRSPGMPQSVLVAVPRWLLLVLQGDPLDCWRFGVPPKLSPASPSLPWHVQKRGPPPAILTGGIWLFLRSEQKENSVFSFAWRFSLRDRVEDLFNSLFDPLAVRVYARRHVQCQDGTRRRLQLSFD